MDKEEKGLNIPLATLMVFGIVNVLFIINNSALLVAIWNKCGATKLIVHQVRLGDILRLISREYVRC